MRKPLFDDDELFYMNGDGFMVFTAEYLLKRGYCCGNGCKHCPYEYKAVENELARKRLIEKQKNEMKAQTDWTDAVYDVARQIPRGKVTSYGFIAKIVGTSPRMVGWAMNKAGNQKPKVPAHRVVNRQGLLTGAIHFETPTRMQEMLEKEGVQVKNNQIINFEKYLWQPK